MSDLLTAHRIRLRANTPLIDVAFRQGEIIGLAGLDGHGQEEFLEVLSGIRTPLSGEIRLSLPDGRTTVITDFHKAVRHGVVYLPRNRKVQGILPPLSVLDNFVVSSLGKTGRWGFVNRQKQQQQLEKYRERLSIVFASPNAPITSLSGGNQQKVLLARWMALNPYVMLLNDPTRGVDIPTRMKLYEVFRQLAAEEKTTLVLLSTEIEEIMQLCNRTLVFRDGTLFRTLDQSEMTMKHVIAAMFGRAYES